MRLTRWTVAQIGAREHYAIPAGFSDLQVLRHLYTDAWCPSWLKWSSRVPGPLRHWAARRSDSIPDRQVTAFNYSGMVSRLMDRTTANAHEAYIRTGRLFAEQVAQKLRRVDLDRVVDAFFSFNTGCLETLHYLNGIGVPSVVGQIDPARVEMELVQREIQRWPGWEHADYQVPQTYWDRLSAEWKAATRVLVNSPWACDALIQQGVAAEKLLVVPLSYRPPPVVHREPVGASTKLSVLWLGSVTLRKGIPYLIEAARSLQKVSSIRFTVAGPIHIAKEAIASAPPNIRFIGRVARTAAADLYRAADVFVLPTVSDGFAITQLEAMAWGVPVIATPNCGQVVTDGLDGFITPAGDAEALAAAVLTLHSDRKRLKAMGEAARRRSQQFSPSRHARQITEAIEMLRGHT